MMVAVLNVSWNLDGSASLRPLRQASSIPFALVLFFQLEIDLKGSISPIYFEDFENGGENNWVASSPSETFLGPGLDHNSFGYWV